MAFILGRAFGSFRGAAPRLAASVAAARAPASLAPMLLSLYSPRVQPTALHLRMLSTGPSEIDYHALALNRLKPNPGAHKAHVRVGRGRGGGKGKTSGRGNKGAGARKGKKIPYAGFAGGQTPLHRRIPKRGFSNKRFERVFAELNLDTLARWIRNNRIEVVPGREIGLKDLQDSGAVSITMHHAGVKLLGNGADEWDIPISIAVSAASKTAIQAIERAGGSIRTVFHDKLGLRAELNPHKFAVLPRTSYPPPRLMQRYMDEEKRGYLSHLQKSIENPGFLEARTDQEPAEPQAV